jgi:hypothetical protein
MRLPEALRSLRYRDFRAFFGAQTISQIATWMHSVAEAWLILSLTNSPLLLSAGRRRSCSAARATFSSSPRWPRSAWRVVRAASARAVGGAITLGTVVSRHPPLALLDASAAASCSVLLALCLIESVWLVAVALFLLGYTGVIASAGCQTSLQLRSSDELRGRVMSLFTLIHGGCFPIAAPLIGAVAERWDVRTALFVRGAGGLTTLAVLMGARYRISYQPDVSR